MKHGLCTCNLYRNKILISCMKLKIALKKLSIALLPFFSLLIVATQASVVGAGSFSCDSDNLKQGAMCYADW